MARLVWNAIVKNEAARIERCIDSLLPYIVGAVIVDTGSTDDTCVFIERRFAKAGKFVEIHHADFEDFSQARNCALQAARQCVHPFDYLLLVDADMELRVDVPWVFDNLDGPGYDLEQRNGGVRYSNRRLVHRDQTGLYVGVTHEYLDVPGGGCLSGAYFIDHADGANRVDKFERDIVLLRKALTIEKDQRLRARYWFYLGQSYRDAGEWVNCAQAYYQAMHECSWDEEQFIAHLGYANAQRMLNNLDGFVAQTLLAYQRRPSRKEALYDLARYFREQEKMQLAVLFSMPGLEARAPGDTLFVPEFPYQAGFREEFSIAAFYTDQRAKGFMVTDALALDRAAPAQSRELAKANLYFYIRPLRDFCPSYVEYQIDFTPEAGWAPMNPSIVNWHERLMLTIRTVNYVIDQDGRYLIDGKQEAPIRTRTFLTELAPDFKPVIGPSEIASNLPESPAWDMVRGLEDQRLFVCDGELFTISCVRELNPMGFCEQVVSRLYGKGTAWYEVIKRQPVENQKNWMPWSNTRDPVIRMRFLYRLGHVVDSYGRDVSKVVDRERDLDAVSGGSQVIPFRDAYLCVVHEARHDPSGKRWYMHRFAYVNNAGVTLKLSRPWILQDRQIEYVMGLAHHPDGKRLVLSFGIRDAQAWLATVTDDDVWAFFNA